MQDDENTKLTDINLTTPIPLTAVPSGQKEIHPSPAFVEELQAQQQQTPQPLQPTVVSLEPAQPSQPTPSQPIHPGFRAPSNGQMQVGMSASQMGYNEPKNKLLDFNPTKLITKAVVGFVALGGILAVLVATNIIPLSQFKTIEYVNSKGIHYRLNFYTKHSTKTISAGNTQLVSKVSKGGKFPLTLSIANGDESWYSRVKNCGSYTKVFDVQNDNLDQKISVCNLPLGQNTPAGVYVAGILYNNQTSIVTFSQDLSGTDLSSPSGAQQSLAKFGLDPYQDDIRKITASIKVR
ncbi:hypothetical protein IPL68_05345 [Candidatus Saccharibacteria bacterium]|nr:MAG: hypothetical protein IPL68_05345 [Candidatus Saccharibacteria bacterium]